MQNGRKKTGLIIYNLFPLLVGPVKAWREHLPRIKAMGFNVVYVNPFHLAGSSGSLYSIKDTGELDPRFKSAPDDGDDAIQQFDDEARRYGLKVMIDLVVNHAARDSVLLDTNAEFFARDEHGEPVTPYANDPSVEGGKVFWRDLALFNYADGQIKSRLIDHWDGYLARFQRLGIKAFRCDAAHMVPSDVWLQLIERAKSRDADCIFVAETLGCTLNRSAEVAALGFDYTMSNFKYTDLDSFHVIGEYDRLRRLAPSIAFPESHDTPRYAAQFAGDDVARVSRELVAFYALSAFFSTGVMMPMGYEWGYRAKLDVALSTPSNREETGVDVSFEIAAINHLRRELPPLNVEGVQKRLSLPGEPMLILLRGDGDEIESSRVATLVVANISSDRISISGRNLIRRAERFTNFIDHSPGYEGLALSETTDLTLQVSEVRIFSGKLG